MMRVGKRGLNLAANAAVTAAAKVSWGQTQLPGPSLLISSPSQSPLHPPHPRVSEGLGACAAWGSHPAFNIPPLKDFHSADHSFLTHPKGTRGPRLLELPWDGVRIPWGEHRVQWLPGAPW